MSGNQDKDSIQQHPNPGEDLLGDFDLRTFIYILKKSVKWMFVCFVLSGVAAYLYLRYTPPLYQSSSILQMASHNTAEKVLNVANIYEQELAAEIELMRSKGFIYPALSNLDLGISYFTKGNILNNEMYTASSYTVETRNTYPIINGIPVYVSFPNKTSIHTSYTIGEEIYQKPIDIGKWSHLGHVEIKVNVIDFNRITLQQDQFEQNPFFFIINDSLEVKADYFNAIEINLLNQAAKTIQVSLKETNPKKAADIVNAISDEFIRYDEVNKAKSANKILEFIDAQLALVYNKLYESENLMHSFKKKNKISNDNDLLSIQVGRLDGFENELMNIELETSLLAKIKSSIASENEKDVFNLLPALSGTTFQSELIQVLSPLTELLNKKEEKLYLVTANSEEIKEIDFQIELQRNRILVSVDGFEEKLLVKQDNIEKKIKEIERKFYNLPTQDLEYARLLRLFTINEKFYSNLLEKKAEYSISKAGFISQNLILERAVIPANPISPNKGLVITICLAVAFLLSILIIVIRYLLHDKIISVQDLLHSNLPILGIIPEYKKDIPVSQLLVDKNPKSLIAESFRSIRSNLQFISNEKGAKIATITSTISGEGKTFVAINLAGIIAFSEKKVIVLDLDLRKPKIHLGFNSKNKNGMSTILSGTDNMEECINNSSISNLDFITAGPIPPNPSELIISHKMHELLDKLKELYDVIVIDTPPIGIVTDGLPCIQEADYPIYVLKSNFSKKNYLQNIHELTNQRGLKNLGVILNGVDYAGGYGYKTNYGYGYTYGYGYYEEESETKTNSLFSKIIG